MKTDAEQDARTLKGSGSQAGDDRHRLVSRRQLLRWTLFIVGITAVVALLLVWLVTEYLGSLEALSQSDPALAAQKIRSVAKFMLAATVFIAVAVGAYVASYGYRAVRSECFPPPGSWIVEGRPVQTGAMARRIGWIQIVLGILMAAAACAAAYRTWATLP